MTRPANRPKIEGALSSPEPAGTGRALLDALVAQHAALGEALAGIAERLDAEAAAASQREEEHAARLGEAQRELAEARAALEIERTSRQAAERRLSAKRSAIASAQAALAFAAAETCDDENNRPTVAAEAEADTDAVLPLPAGTTPGGEATSSEAPEPDHQSDEAMLAAMTNSEITALDKLVVMEGYADRASLLRALCIRALTGAGLLEAAPAPESGGISSGRDDGEPLVF
jgi:hypothetical protein